MFAALCWNTTDDLFSMDPRTNLCLLVFWNWELQFVGSDDSESHKLNTEFPSTMLINSQLNFDVLLTVHLSIILVINQLNAQNLVL